MSGLRSSGVKIEDAQGRLLFCWRAPGIGGQARALVPSRPSMATCTEPARRLFSGIVSQQFNSKGEQPMYYYVTVSHLPEKRIVHLAESQHVSEMKELAELISRNALPEINWVKVEDDQNRLMFYWDAKAAVVAHKNPYKPPPKSPTPGPLKQ
jgi:hypothetical protein